MRVTDAISGALRLFVHEQLTDSPDGIKIRVKLFKTFAPGSHRFLLVSALLFSLTITADGQSTQTFSVAGAATFIPPAGVTSITVHAWGGGGCSGQNTDRRARGGGGGGAFTTGILTVTPGVPIDVFVGAGGIYNNNATATDDGNASSVGTLVANGGSRGVIGDNVAQNGGLGGTASPNPGGIASFLSYAGGKGGNGFVAANNGGGGGGGASASSTGAGNVGGNGTSGGGGGAGGAGNAGGGDGGRGSNDDGTPNSTSGNAPGGGGGGRGDHEGNNTNGGTGQVIITWTLPTGICPGNAITVYNNLNVPNPWKATGTPDGDGAHLNETNDELVLELTNGILLDAGSYVDVIWQRVSSSNTILQVKVSENGTDWTFAGDYTDMNPRNTWITQELLLPVNTRYILFISNNGFDFDIDAISFSVPCDECVTPILYSLTGSGNYCSVSGLPVGLSGSETGVEYQLYLGATPQGSPLPGTGNAISFGNQATAGTYTVIATRIAGECKATMNGNAVLSSSIPSQPAAIAGPANSCIGSSRTYSVPNVAGITYSWSLPADWTISAGQGTSTISVTAGITAGNVSVTASNACGTSVAQTLDVMSGSPSTPDISANYCAGGGYIRLTANGGGAGAAYLWSTGETTASILVNIAGEYSVEVNSAGGCSATASYSISTELVVNGDFSAGNTGFTHSTYIYNADVAGNSELVPEGHYGVGSDPNTYHTNFWGRDHTSGAGNFMIVNGFPGAPQPVIWATTVDVVPGVSYYFSAWALSLNTAGNYAELQFRVNNTLVGTTAPLPARAQNNNPPFNWIQFYGTWIAPPGVFSVPIEIVDLQTAAAGNDFGLDDISFATLAPLPAVIAPSSNETAFCIGQTLNLFANLKGGKPPYTFAWTGPAGFTSDIANPSIPNVTAANSGIYNLTITDGYGCAAVTASAPPVKINEFPSCSITGTSTMCPSGNDTYTAPAGMSNYTWSIAGNGSVVGLTNGQTVNVTAGALNNASFTLSLTIADGIGCSSECQQVFSVEDAVPPTFALPLLDAGYCVEYVSDELYNPDLEDTYLDNTYIRPDYFLFAKGSTLLNLIAVADNCALAIDPVAWTIDFGNDGSVELAGTGELSVYGSDIQFPLGTNRIHFTVTDAVGNTRVQFVDITVMPRPVISNNF